MDYAEDGGSMSKLRNNNAAGESEQNTPYEYIYRNFHIDSRDHLTNLPDMQGFLEIIPRAKAKILDNGGIPAVVFFDLDGMKVYNSSYGLAAGDRLLRAFAEILRRHYGTSSCGRFNADHFIAITAVEGLEDTLERIFIELADVDMEQTLPVSVGIYRYVHDDITPIDACDRAKLACDANSSYGSGYTWFDDTMGHRYMKQAYILSHLGQAMEEGWIQPCFQPVVRTLSNRLCGCEVLARWNDPKYGLISPAEFIPVLESSALSWKLDSFIARKAMEILKDRQASGEPVVPISINVSRADFDVADPVSSIVEMMDELELDKVLVKVEITESTLMNDKELMRKALDRFHDAGIEVWMDDFGSGFSSLNVLKDFNFDEIKIDMAFLKNLDDRGKKIITAVVRMAKQLGIHTLAEGVETKEHYNFLKEIGCEKLQGYYFSKPVYFEELQKKIKEKNIECENHEQCMLYEKVGFKDLISDQAVAIFIDDGRSFKLIFENEAYRKLAYSDNIVTTEDVEHKMNSTSTPLGARFRRLADSVILNGRTEYMTFVSENRFFRISFELLGVIRQGAILFAVASETDEDTDLQKSLEIEAVLKNLVSVYESIYLIDYANNIRRVIVSSIPDERDGSEIRGLHAFYQNYTVRHIYPDDLERFRNFLDKGYIEESLKRSSNGCIAERFRVLQPKGNYEWMVFFVMQVPSGRHQLLAGVRMAYFHERPQAAGCGGFAREEDVHKAHPGHLDRILWRSFVESSDMKIFWKDRERRFLGAGDAFLKFFGVSFEEELKGRTELEVGWNPAPTRYMDESRVLEHGEVLQDIPEQIIVDGVLKNVRTTKLPIYSNGIIIGLIGWFEEVSQTKDVIFVKDRGDSDTRQRQIDELTKGRELDELIIRIARILNSNADDGDAINRCLSLLGNELHPDRLYIFELEGWQVLNTYEWLAEGVESQLENRKSFDYDYIKEWEKIIIDDTSIRVTDVHEHKWEHEKFYRYIDRVGISRFIAAPLYSEGRLVGYLGAENYNLEKIRETKKLLETISYFIGDRITNSKLMKQMKKLGYSDALTGFGNRNALSERIKQIQETESPFGIIYADLNGLKDINDTLGHAAGDKAICNAGNLLGKFSGDSNVYRHGGDEFVVVIDNISEESFRDICQRISSSVGYSMTAHMALGYTWGRGSNDVDEAMVRAETRMYRDKTAYYTLHDRRR